MPLYNMQEESGRTSVRLKVLQLVEQDIADYGALARTDFELEERARYHVAQMQANLPTPQTKLTDDINIFTQSVITFYAIIYKGLLVGYTGLKEPFRLPLTPRYQTSAAFDESGFEHNFVGLSVLQAIIREEQTIRHKNAEANGGNANGSLRTFVQVTIRDAKQASADRPCFICYTLVDHEITGICAQREVSDEILLGLGLPLFKTANRKVET